jgi:hypothetical protein
MIELPLEAWRFNGLNRRGLTGHSQERHLLVALPVRRARARASLICWRDINDCLLVTTADDAEVCTGGELLMPRR